MSDLKKRILLLKVRNRFLKLWRKNWNLRTITELEWP